MTEDTSIYDFHLEIEDWRRQGYHFYLFKPTSTEVWGHSAKFDIETRPLSCIIRIYTEDMEVFNEIKEFLIDCLDVEMEDDDNYVRWCI